MPDQSEHEKLENLVDAPGQAERSAHSLQEAVDSRRTLEGYEAMNNEKFPDSLSEEAENASDDEKAGITPR